MHTPSDPDTPQDASQDVRGDVLSAAEAARVAGVHTRSVRRAISEGRLLATMEEGAYRITPAALAAWRATRSTQHPGDASQDARVGPTQDARGDVPGPVPGPALAGVADVIAAKDETISTLSAQVADLQERLTAAAEAQRRADHLHMSLLSTVAALTATTGVQRPDAPTRVPDAPGSTEGVSEGVASSWWATMLRKVRGG